MSDLEKYKIIFQWFILKLKYDYSALDSDKAHTKAQQAFSIYKNDIRKAISKIDTYTELSSIEQLIQLIKVLQEDKANEELIQLKKEELYYRKRSENFRQKEKRYRHGNVLVSRYGVCQDFATEYEAICNRLGLPCKTVQGSILSDGISCSHAWNAIMINGKVKYVDISSAIHCADGHDTINNPYDFFNKTFSELTKNDNGKNREIYSNSQEEIKAMIQESPGWNYDD